MLDTHAHAIPPPPPHTHTHTHTHTHSIYVHTHQLLEMMGGLMERPVIAQDFKAKYSILLEMYEADLDQVKAQFDRQLSQVASSDGPMVNKNMPQVAGLLQWSQELRERVEGSMQKIQMFDHG